MQLHPIDVHKKERILGKSLIRIGRFLRKAYNSGWGEFNFRPYSEHYIYGKYVEIRGQEDREPEDYVVVWVKRMILKGDEWDYAERTIQAHFSREFDLKSVYCLV